MFCHIYIMLSTMKIHMFFWQLCKVIGETLEMSVLQLERLGNKIVSLEILVGKTSLKYSITEEVF